MADPVRDPAATAPRARVQPLAWMRRLRDEPQFTKSVLAVLWALALRMGADGSGWAPHDQLAADVGATTKTAERATAAARAAGYLIQTRRGHRVTATTALASEWRLCLPVDNGSQSDTHVRLGDTQPLAGDGLEDLQPDTDVGLAVTQPDISATQPDISATQPDTHVRLSGLSTSGLSAASERAALIMINKTGATEAEAVAAVALIQAERQPDKIAGFVRRLAEDGELPEWLERVRVAAAKASIAGWRASLKAMPPCRHGQPGGDQLRPDNGRPQCALCRGGPTRD